MKRSIFYLDDEVYIIDPAQYLMDYYGVSRRRADEIVGKYTLMWRNKNGESGVLLEQLQSIGESEQQDQLLNDNTWRV